MLVGGGQGKRILREAFHGDLPEEIFGRRKQGFAVPIGAWFRGDLRGPLTELLGAADSFAKAYFAPGPVERLLAEHQGGGRDHTHRLFSLLMLELWWREAGATVE